jgi:hypothetical protein
MSDQLPKQVKLSDRELSYAMQLHGAVNSAKAQAYEVTADYLKYMDEHREKEKQLLAEMEEAKKSISLAQRQLSTGVHTLGVVVHGFAEDDLLEIDGGMLKSSGKKPS